MESDDSSDRDNDALSPPMSPLPEKVNTIMNTNGDDK